MKLLTIWSSADPFSHEMSLQAIRDSINYGEDDLQNYLETFKKRFQMKSYSAVSIVLVEVNSNTGEVTVLENIQGRHPLKSRKVVNPEASVARDARRAATLARAGKKILFAPGGLQHAGPAPNFFAEVVAQNVAVNPVAVNNDGGF